MNSEEAERQVKGRSDECALCRGSRVDAVECSVEMGVVGMERGGFAGAEGGRVRVERVVVRGRSRERM